MEATILHLGKSCLAASFCQVLKAPFISLRRTLRGTDSLGGASSPSYPGSVRLQAASAPRINLWKIASCPDPDNISQVQKAPFISLRRTLRGTDSLGGASPPSYPGSIQAASAPRINLRKFSLFPSHDTSQENLVNLTSHAANGDDGDEKITIRKSEVFCLICRNKISQGEENILLRTKCSCYGEHLVHETCLIKWHDDKQTHKCNKCEEAIRHKAVTINSHPRK